MNYEDQEKDQLKARVQKLEEKLHIEKEKHHNQADLMRFFQTDRDKPPVRKVLEIKVPERSLKVLKYKRQAKFTKKAKLVPGSTY